MPLPSTIHCRAKPGFLWLRTILLLALVIPFHSVNAQQFPGDKLKIQIIQAKSDSARVVHMGELCRFYYASKDFPTADSLFERQVMLAESTLKEHLVLDAYFNNTGFLVTSAKTKDRTEITTRFVRRAIEYAKATDRSDFVALGYAHLAAINLADGQTEEAFKNATLANTNSINADNDSIRVATTIQLGKVYQERSDVVMAFKIFTSAHNIALESKNDRLMPAVHHAMATLYHKFKKEEEAKKYINKSLRINKNKKDIPGQVSDNIFLAKFGNYTAAKAYLQEAVRLADEIDNIPLKIEAERLLFFRMLLEETPSHMQAFLRDNAELTRMFINTGPSYLDWLMAEIYLYGSGGRLDSALFYFRRAEPAFSSGYDLNQKKAFFAEYADCCRQLNNNDEAIYYYGRSYELSNASSDLSASKLNTNWLKQLYEEQGDYKQAYAYSQLYDRYKDSVDQLGRERDLALLEIESVAKEQRMEAALAAQRLARKYNIQYMMITVAIIIVFILLIVVGMFKVSAFAIRAMGFLSLIFFFEFIILILDNWIHHITHGEPLKVLLIKIVIISILLPIHHYVEHKLIRYLLSRHLITVKSRIAEYSFFRKKKAKAPPTDVIQQVHQQIGKDQSQEAGGGQTVPNSK